MANKTIDLYDGTERITFREGPHTYNHRIHGIVPNATGVVKVMPKPALIPWAARKASEHWLSNIEPGEIYDEVQLEKLAGDAKVAYDTYSGERRSVGKVVHTWCENMALYEMGLRDKAPKMPVNPDAKKGCEAWKKWRKGKDIEWFKAERILFHNKDIHVGTADGMAIINGTHTVLDYKTGSGVWAEAGLQTASYVASAGKEFGFPWTEAERMVVHLNARTGRQSTWDEQRIQEKLTGWDCDTDYQQFLTCLATYNWIVGGPNKWSFLGRS